MPRPAVAEVVSFWRVRRIGDALPPFPSTMPSLVPCGVAYEDSFVIDVLDECNSNDDRRLILNYIHGLIHIHHLSLSLRFLVVSGSEPLI